MRCRDFPHVDLSHDALLVWNVAVVEALDNMHVVPAEESFGERSVRGLRSSDLLRRIAVRAQVLVIHLSSHDATPICHGRQPRGVSLADSVHGLPAKML